MTGPKGVRDALLLNKGDGRFEDASRAFHLPDDRASVGVAAGDFDADRYVDVFLTGIGGNRLLRNRQGKQFEDISKSIPSFGAPALALTARWLDLDQDGDLDLYILNYCDADLADSAFTSAAIRRVATPTRSTAMTASPSRSPAGRRPTWRLQLSHGTKNWPKGVSPLHSSLGRVRLRFWGPRRPIAGLPPLTSITIATSTL